MEWFAAGVLVAGFTKVVYSAITCRQCDREQSAWAQRAVPNECEEKLTVDTMPPQMKPCDDSPERISVYCRILYGFDPRPGALKSQIRSGCAVEVEVLQGVKLKPPSSVFSCRRDLEDRIHYYSCYCKNGPDGKPCNNYDFTTLNQAWKAMSALTMTDSNASVWFVVDMATVSAASTFKTLQTVSPLLAYAPGNFWGKVGVSINDIGIILSSGPGGDGTTAAATSAGATSPESTTGASAQGRNRASLIASSVFVLIAAATMVSPVVTAKGLM